jgi:cystathionine beta-lyase/cystathionine gamma-synthase
MRGGGSVLAFEIHRSFEETDRFVSKLMLAKRSASFGSFETLVVHPAAMWAGMMSAKYLADSAVPATLVRCSVGLEHPDDLIADLHDALRGNER